MSIMKLNYGGGICVQTDRTRYRYAVYEHKLIFDANSIYKRSFIVIKNQYNIIVYFTSFHKYIDAYENGICVPLMSDAKTKMYYICAMLNYIFIDNYDKYKIDHIFNIEKWMLDDFFTDYSLQKKSNGQRRSNQTIEKCVFTITTFMRKLWRKYEGYMKIGYDELYVEKLSFTRKGNLQKKHMPNFVVRTMQTQGKIFRDIPSKVFNVIINQAYINMPELVFPICLSAFAGLRPGEVCNVRQENSPLGKGIIITSLNGVIRTIEIDLRNEFVLRSDGIECGRIKKERLQKVYPPFIPAFNKAYEFHKKILKENYEQEYCPMFVGRNGKALTYYAYRNAFCKLITEFVRPALLKNDDSECQLYGQLLYENNLGPHAMRHFFTVQLVLMGEDVAGIQFWRGDSTPESALRYLQNKGDLIKELSEANNIFADFMMSAGGDFYAKN